MFPTFGLVFTRGCTFLDITIPEIQGAKSGGEKESAQGKNKALKDAGAVVPTSYEALEAAIKETFDKLVYLHHSILFMLGS